MSKTKESASAYPELRTERLGLRFPNSSDVDALLEFHRRNHSFLAPTSPPQAESYLTREHWEAHVAWIRDGFEQGHSCRFYLFEGEQIVGKIGFSQISRGPFMACYVGYALGEEHQGQGKMLEAARAAIGYAFGPLMLHRIMANYLPTNERSGALLRRLGFVVEGYARDYLYIGGRWRDHILTSLTNQNQVYPNARPKPT